MHALLYSDAGVFFSPLGMQDALVHSVCVSWKTFYHHSILVRVWGAV